MKQFIFLFAFVIGAMSRFSLGDSICDSPCKCEKHPSEFSGENVWQVNCLNYNLTEMPVEVKWPTNITVDIIDFKSNKIEDIFQFTTEHDDLVILRFSDNWISRIEESAFHKLSDLRELYLDHNRLTRFHPDTFSGLELLGLLDLSYNDIRHFPTNIFKDMVALEDLRIGNNQLKVIDPYVMQPLESLKFLDASNIGCEQLSSNVLHNQIYLERVDLSNNKFEQVPNKALGLLHENPELGIKYLYLDGNRIKGLNSNSFKGLESLVAISLCQMDSFQEIRDYTFSSLKELISVKISSNPALTKIEENAFKGLFSGVPNEIISLKEVHLNDNNLGKLSENLLPWGSLQVANLQGNNWNCDCHMKWFSKFKNQFENAASNFKCSSPKKLATRKITELSESDFVCPVGSNPRGRHGTSHSSAALIWGIVTTIVAVVCFTIIVFVIRKRSLHRSSRKRHGVIRYRKAQTQPDNMDPVEL